MQKVTNHVLYAVHGGERRPLVSLSGNDKLSPFEVATRVNAASVAEFARCDRAGVAHPRLKLVRETRQADEGGRLVLAEYCECDPNGDDAGEVVPALDQLFSEVK